MLLNRDNKRPYNCRNVFQIQFSLKRNLLRLKLKENFKLNNLMFLKKIKFSNQRKLKLILNNRHPYEVLKVNLLKLIKQLGLQNESLINQRIKQIKEKNNRSIQKLFRIPKRLKIN